MRSKKLILAVIDGAKPAMLERAVADGRAPSLELLIDRGSYVPDAASVFPSVTPVCAASIATGLGQDRHLIPSMNWYRREEERYVEYGSSFRAARRFGFAQQLTDTVYNMNGAHLAPQALTVFERLDDAELRTMGTTYLMYRGRHRHEASQDTALSRFASRALIRHPVMGPRELFYADVFASRDTGCRSQLGMPGVRDKHAGCVGSYAIEHDLFDFMLFSLPDNDNHSHKYGPHAQVDSIAEADRQLGRLIDTAGGAERFLSTHAVIVIADHSHTAIEASISLGEEFADFQIAQPAGDRGEGGELALSPAQRSATTYPPAPGLPERVLARVWS
ncbi:MAG: alkaline phosphatase family protein, partial [Solirubrobacteraceae bacterium]